MGATFLALAALILGFLAIVAYQVSCPEKIVSRMSSPIQAIRMHGWHHWPLLEHQLSDNVLHVGRGTMWVSRVLLLCTGQRQRLLARAGAAVTEIRIVSHLVLTTWWKQIMRQCRRHRVLLTRKLTWLLPWLLPWMVCPTENKIWQSLPRPGTFVLSWQLLPHALPGPLDSTHQVLHHARWHVPVPVHHALQTQHLRQHVIAAGAGTLKSICRVLARLKMPILLLMKTARTTPRPVHVLARSQKSQIPLADVDAPAIALGRGTWGHMVIVADVAHAHCAAIAGVTDAFKWLAAHLRTLWFFASTVVRCAFSLYGGTAFQKTEHDPGEGGTQPVALCCHVLRDVPMASRPPMKFCWPWAKAFMARSANLVCWELTRCCTEMAFTRGTEHASPSASSSILLPGPLPRLLQSARQPLNDFCQCKMKYICMPASLCLCPFAAC